MIWLDYLYLFIRNGFLSSFQTALSVKYKGKRCFLVLIYGALREFIWRDSQSCTGVLSRAKISWKFRSKRKWNGSDQVEICPVKVVHLQRWSSLTGRFSRILRFRFQKFSFPVPLQLVTTVKMADGSDVSVYECRVCKLQTQELNVLLMHSCTQGSGTVAVHLNLFFLLVFVSF